MRDSIIYLVGFMGSGKTTVGMILARRLGWRFVDLDIEIEARAGRPIRQIFAEEGEPRFRALESDELRRVSGSSRAVVALGGGAFCSEANREAIHTSGISIWLDAPLAAIFERCPPDGTRPLFSAPAEMEALLARRLPHYRLARIHIETGMLSAEAVSDLIISALESV